MTEQKLLQEVAQNRPLNETRMFLLGQGGVGKTSLLKQLMGSDFDPYEGKTEGIYSTPWCIKVDSRNIRLNVWDFGGQEIMPSLHHFFLTKRSLYLVVLNVRVEPAEKQIERWVKMIQSFGDRSPIIIVGNKNDQYRLDLDRDRLLDSYAPNLKDIVETSCAEGDGIAKLKEAISREVAGLEHIRDKLPNSWFAIKTQLEEIKQDCNCIPYIPYSEYIRLCQDQDIRNDTSQRNLIRLLHDLGIVINFQDDPDLKDIIILDHEWVTNSVYRILNSYELFHKKGVLSEQALDRVLNSQENPGNKHIIDIMRRCDCPKVVGFELTAL